MFYSQIILAKKTPLGQLWMAAHFNDRKLSRSQIFATDISESVDNIVRRDGSVPMALRLSGHLLLGVVRIYSRKVHYLWQDCHQAMSQIQTAFLHQPNADLAAIDMDAGKETKRRRRTKTSGDHEGDEVMDDAIPTTAFQGFGIPFDLNDDSFNDAEDWMPAEIDRTEGQDGTAAAFGLGATPQQDRRSRIAREQAELSMRLDDSTSEGRPIVAAAAEEQWTAFDPDEEEEAEDRKIPAEDERDEPIFPYDEPMLPPDSEEVGAIPLADEKENEPTLPPDQQKGRASEVEIFRAGASVGSNSESMGSRRVSTEMAKTGHDSTVSEPEPLTPQDVSGVPILDDDDAALGVDRQSRHSSFRLDRSSEGTGKPHDESSAANVSLGGGSKGSAAPEVDTGSKKRPSGEANIKKRKRRKVTIRPDGETELTSAEIKKNLADTSDIVHQPPPFGQKAKDDELPPELRGLIVMHVSPLLMKFMSCEEAFRRPALADTGGGAPELLGLWVECARLRGEAREQALKSQADAKKEKAEQDEKEEEQEQDEKEEEQEQDEKEEEQEQDEKEEEQEQDEKEEEQEQDEKEEGSVEVDEPVEAGRVNADEEKDEDSERRPSDDEENGIPLPAEEEEAFLPPDDEGAPTLPEPGEPEREDDTFRKSSFDLGHVNNLEEDAEWNETQEDDRQAGGDDIVSSDSKWHRHTIKVYSLLKSNMAFPGEAVKEGKESRLYYNSLTSGCSRRTAVGVFFELLQLKTWDFIELNQEESYGDITISPGVRFAEPVPK